MMITNITAIITISITKGLYINYVITFGGRGAKNQKVGI